MFRPVPLSIIRSFSPYTQKCYVIQVCWQLASRIRTELQFRPGPARKLSANLQTCMTLLRVQWKTPDDGQWNCPKHVEFYSINKFKKLVHLVGFIIRIYHDARSPERQRRNSNSVRKQLLLDKLAILAKIAYELRHVCPPSVRLSECNSSAPTGQNSVGSDFHYPLSIKPKSDKNNLNFTRTHEYFLLLSAKYNRHYSGLRLKTYRALWWSRRYEH